MTSLMTLPLPHAALKWTDISKLILVNTDFSVGLATLLFLFYPEYSLLQSLANFCLLYLLAVLLQFIHIVVMSVF